MQLVSAAWQHGRRWRRTHPKSSRQQPGFLAAWKSHSPFVIEKESATKHSAEAQPVETGKIQRANVAVQLEEKAAAPESRGQA